ncbi:unnamed protein product [Arctia plantaginis]|uniref:Uncharacterized protein n=1 Tax=Arctia plantaginis TaxID=874455 RepID=A0A8S0YUN5_ARCPL|nr:unnamed protein product [Arctia plantaginis]CAB3247975.1 unnamed protein product [Arctia plantaginis]
MRLSALPARVGGRAVLYIVNTLPQRLLPNSRARCQHPPATELNSRERPVLQFCVCAFTTVSRKHPATRT